MVAVARFGFARPPSAPGSRRVRSAPEADKFHFMKSAVFAVR